MFPKIVVLPNHPISIGFYIINHPFWGTLIFGNTHIDKQNKETVLSHLKRSVKVSEPKTLDLATLNIYQIHVYNNLYTN